MIPSVAVEITAGLQVPVMPLLEVVGSGSAVAPTQYGPNCVNTGVILGLTTTSIVVVVAQRPAVGVKV